MLRDYQGVGFNKSLRRVNAVAIANIEKELGVAFPDDYRAFLLAINGGVPTPSQFVMAKPGKPGKPGEEICVDFFYGVAGAKVQHGLRHQQQSIINRTDTLPKGFITIGHDPGAAPYFISTTGTNAGVIHFYEPDGFLDPGGLPRLYVAADSFTDLLVRLAVGCC